MSLPVELLRWLHVIGASVLLGTGAGIAFFFWAANRRASDGSRDAGLIAAVGRIVVVADFLFTATAVVAQPVTGALLAAALGHSLGEGWLAASLALYGLTGLCWLPVVFIQIKLRDLARAAAASGAPLPPEYERLYGVWLALGVPAFAAVLAILWLMQTRPVLW